jgi:hypothetical protein
VSSDISEARDKIKFLYVISVYVLYVHFKCVKMIYSNARGEDEREREEQLTVIDEDLAATSAPST